MSGPLAAAQHIFDHDLTAERWRQHKTWGVQHHPDGTGRPGIHYLADLARNTCKEAFDEGRGTWRHILTEEYWEALAESETGRLRAELVQVATVCVAWIEDIDSRAGDRAAVIEPEPVDAGLAARQSTDEVRESTDAVREDLQRWMVSA